MRWPDITAGKYTNQNAVGYDEIPVLKNIALRIRTETKPDKIMLQPGDEELSFDYKDGISTVIVPEVPVHKILEIIP